MPIAAEQVIAKYAKGLPTLEEVMDADELTVTLADASAIVLQGTAKHDK